MRLIGYLRLSTEDGDYGIDVQRATIAGVASPVRWIEDRASGKSLKRAGVREALDLLDRGEADGIVVSRLDRLSRSVLDFAAVIKRAQAGGWNVIVVEQGLDLSTAHGRFAAHILMAAAEYERELIGLRTSAALRVARDERGVRLGRPAVIPEHVARRVLREREDGLTFQSIADGLNDDGVPRPSGPQWTRQSVAALHARYAA